MLVSVTGFGSLWRWRFDKNQDYLQRFAHGVYYNTTGVEIAGTFRQRPKLTGYARFHARGGFDPHHPSRMIGRVFECSEPCVWQGHNKLLFQRLLSAPEKPDRFFVASRNGIHGALRIGSQNWRSIETWLISFSECRDKQEALLLMPAHGWIETEWGRCVLQPSTQRPWAARLILTSSA